MRYLIKNIKNFTIALLVILISIIFVIYCFLFVERKVLYPLAYKDYVLEYSAKNDLSASLVFSVIKIESNFKKEAVSAKGAVGLMQILPATADYIASKLDLQDYNIYDEKTNIQFGCYYLRYLFNKFNDKTLVLCAYNAGEGKVNKWLGDKEYSLDGKTLINIPYKETNNYVNKINKSIIKYNKIYKNILDK